LIPVIYFLRHGETDWNAARRLQGHADVPLNDKGRAQAARNGRTLAGVIARPEELDFVSSPLSRATETMEIVREQLGLPRQGYRADARLREVHYGDWEGQFWDDIAARDPEATAAYRRNRWVFSPPGAQAENLTMLTERLMDWYATVARDTVVVSHGGPMRSIRAALLPLSPEEAGTLEVPQDKVLRIEGTALSWI
jgi:probable phosphoglycerate mutase